MAKRNKIKIPYREGIKKTRIEAGWRENLGESINNDMFYQRGCYYRNNHPIYLDR